MTTRRTRSARCAILMLAFVGLSAGVTAQEKDTRAATAAAAAARLPAGICRAPGATAALDLIRAGGFDTGEVEILARALGLRIAALGAL